MNEDPPEEALKKKIWKIVFEAETPMGKAFDIGILCMIIVSVIVVMLETVDSVQEEHRTLLYGLEWMFTILFMSEYFLRLWLTRKPHRYAFSFFGLVDLFSFVPTLLTLLPMVGTAGASLIVIRILRLLRIFRVLKMVNHVRGADVIMRGLATSRAKITVFFLCVLILAVIAGTLIYVVESPTNDRFENIPASIYYAIVSISTVGYGDMTVITPMGKFLTSVMILTGYAIIAVPTGIVSSAMIQAETNTTTRACPGCGSHGHLDDAVYCRHCGNNLSINKE